MENSSRIRSLALSVVCLSAIAGGWLRLSGLDAKSISHPEMYVPNIRLPEGISEPAERLTIPSILTGTFSSDTHPPGYYLFMFPWTKALGTSLTVMRFPSALLGTASILLVYAVGALAGWPMSGAVAAALLALSGYHVFWSKVARMFALDCLLGLAATALLLLIVQGKRPRRWLMVGYVALILAGVATHVFFWSLLAIHILWVFANAWEERELPDIARAQLLALVLGSPLIAFAAYQSANTVADLSNDSLRFLSDFLQFGFVLPTSRSGGFFASAIPFTGKVIFVAARIILELIAVLLLAWGLRSLWRSPRVLPGFAAGRAKGFLWKWGWIASGGIATGAILAFLELSRRLPPDQLHDTIRLTRDLLPLPFLLAAAALVLDWRWGSLPSLGRWYRPFGGERGLVMLLAIGPFVLLSILAQFRPILNERGLLFAVPYLLLLLGIGMVSLPRGAWLALLPVVGVAFAASLFSYRAMTVDPIDYNRFVNELTSRIGPHEMVFIRKGWNQTPLLYYLKPDRYSIVGQNYRAAAARNPSEGIWLVLMYDAAANSEIEEVVSAYRPVQTVTAPQAKAVLYQRITVP